MGFLLRLTLPRFFLLAGIASATILVPPGLILSIQDHFPTDGLLLLSYGEASAIFVALWSFSRFESASRIEQTALS